MDVYMQFDVASVTIFSLAADAYISSEGVVLPRKR